MLVGENSVRIATDGSNISVKTRQKYATGGITDGIEVKWSKPRPPDTVLEIIGPTDTVFFFFLIKKSNNYFIILLFINNLFIYSIIIIIIIIIINNIK